MPRSLLGLILRVLAVLAVACGAAPGQEDAGEIQLSILQPGVGGAMRDGSWAGIQVRVNDLAAQPRNIILRVQGVDADGDRPLYDRTVATQPGLAQAFWVYQRVPFSTRGGGEVSVRAFEALDAGGGEGEPGFRAGRLLGSAQVQVASRVESTDSAIAVMGQADYGLRGYQLGSGSWGWPATAHDVVRVVNGLGVGQLPDRWQGLAVFEALVWGRGADQTDPGNLTPEQALAIERWVQRGGHLIVVLPSSGQEWVGQASNRLRHLLPAMGVPVRHDGVDLGPYRALLTVDPVRAVPSSAVVHELVPAPDAGRGEAVPVIVGPDGRCVVMRRLIGSGAVTVVGLDLASAGMRAAQLPEAEAFWHRVLGRRGRIYTDEQLQAEQVVQYVQGRDAVTFDDDLGTVIAMKRSAAQGMLLGLFVFVVYWLVAGPVGFAVLAKRGRKEWAWPAFGASILVFTGVAWVGAAVLRPKRVTGQHVTLVEQVYGQEFSRARSWVSVLIPEYGDAAIGVGAGGEGDLVAPWDPASAELGLSQTFPDNRGYAVEARDPWRLAVPTRQTVKQVVVDWAGPPRWGMIRPYGEVGEAGRLELVPSERRGGMEISGKLVHDLPGELEDVLVVVVERQTDVTAVSGVARNGLKAVVSARAWPRWAPQQVLDLAPAESNQPARATAAEDFFVDLLRRGRPTLVGVGGGGDVMERLRAVRFFTQLDPTDLGPNTGAGDEVGRRRETQGWDLGRWFTQPCVIVVGRLATGRASVEAAPVPLTVDGRAVPMAGQTVVAWVYPLEAAPPGWGFTGMDGAWGDGAASESSGVGEGG